MPDNETPTVEKEKDFVANLVARGEMLADKVIKQIEEAVEDVKALVVFTAAVHPDAQIENNLKGGVVDWENLKAKVTAMASTRIEIDGDVSAMIPAASDAPEIRDQLMQLHRENLTLAQENVRRLLDTLLTFVEIGAKIANVQELQDLGKIKESIDHRAAIPQPTQSTIPQPTQSTIPQPTQSTIPQPTQSTTQTASKSSSPK